MVSPLSAPQGPFPPMMQPVATAPVPGAFPMPQPGMPQIGLPQPGVLQPGIPMVPQGGWSPPNTTCPSGLEYLMALDHLFINQKVELFEAFTGWETKNKYSVVNVRGDTIFYVVEESGLCSRFCLGSYRRCKFRIFDTSSREVLRMVRPLRCNSCCCPCCLQELEVYSGDTLLGSVTQDWSLWRPSFSVRNASGETVLIIRGPWLRFCVEVAFKVRSADGEHRVGVIRKQWSGLTREFFTDADVFGINFPVDLDVKIKAVLLGACLLIDYMYFEQQTKVNV